MSPTRETMGGHRLQITEYEVRVIDEFGDAIDVDHYDDDHAAMIAARAEMDGGALAVVVEQHVSKHPHYGESDRYATLAALGDTAALRAGGWIDDGG